MWYLLERTTKLGGIWLKSEVQGSTEGQSGGGGMCVGMASYSGWGGQGKPCAYWENYSLVNALEVSSVGVCLLCRHQHGKFLEQIISVFVPQTQTFIPLFSTKPCLNTTVNNLRF